MISDLGLRLGIIYLVCATVSPVWWAVLVGVLFGHAVRVLQWFEGVRDRD